MENVEYESVLCVKNEVFVYRIPPRSTNRGYRAADWSLDNPDWTGRMRILAKGKELYIKLEDKTSGDLFATCPVESYPGIAVESVLDSSRYFVLRISDGAGHNAFIGMGFSDRSDSFDLNVALQDHFKWVKQESEIEKASKTFDTGPKLDLGFKEGQTIKLNISLKEGSSKARPKPRGGGTGLLPPPPGSVKLPGPPGQMTQPTAISVQQATETTEPQQPVAAKNNVDPLFDLDQGSSAPTLEPKSTNASDSWGDFATAQENSSDKIDNSADGDWVQF